MPELPEVETVRRHLEPLLLGAVINKAHLPSDYQKALSGLSAEEATERLSEHSVQQLRRKGKYLILELSPKNKRGAESKYLTVHLRMTGRLLLLAKGEPLNETNLKYCTAWFSLSDGSTLAFKDVRKFGRIVVSENLEWIDEKLGPEPLTPAFQRESFQTSLLKRSRALKPLLLDQSFVAGLGNIYVDESLFRAGLHPERSANTLSVDEASRLHAAIEDTLEAAIALNGTTFSSFYFGEEQSGEFISQLKVFGKTGLPCPTCESPIAKTRVAGRGTHLCLTCQPLGSNS